MFYSLLKCVKLTLYQHAEHYDGKAMSALEKLIDARSVAKRWIRRPCLLTSIFITDFERKLVILCSMFTLACNNFA